VLVQAEALSVDKMLLLPATGMAALLFLPELAVLLAVVVLASLALGALPARGLPPGGQARLEPDRPAT
jgi:hypothetical protein